MKRQLLLLMSLTSLALLLVGGTLPSASQPTTPITVLGTAPPERLLDHLAAADDSRKPPLVLVHGWRGLDETAPCLPTALDPTNYADEYWLHLDEDLAALGFDVTLAKLITGYGFDGTTPGCSPVAEANVPHLKTAIDAALLANPTQDKVILIAHSMGGLVSRAYLESDEYRGDVAELYTLGTPHLGVPITGIVNIIEFLTINQINLNEFCISQPVVCQFSDNEALVNDEGFTGIATFNAVHSERRAGIHYHLVGGDADFNDRSNLGVIMDSIIFPAADDGIVPRDSATGINSVSNDLGPLPGPYERRETYELHVETFADSPGLLDTPQRRHTYFSQDEYAVDCGFLGCGDPYLTEALTSQSYLDCLEPVIHSRLPDHRCTGSSLTPQSSPPPAFNAVAPTRFERLSVGQATTRDFWLEAEGGTLFARAATGSRLDVALRTPDGRRIEATQAAAVPNIEAKIEPNGVVFRLRNVTPGRWQLELELIDAPDGAAQTMTWGTYASQAELTARLDRADYRPGEPGMLTVSLPNVADGAVVTATIGRDQVITLTRQGDDYRGSFVAPEEAGYQPLTLAASGTTGDGLPFEQIRHNLLPVAGEQFRLGGRARDSLQPAGSANRRAVDLLIAVEVEATSGGLVGLAADLLDGGGNVIARSNHAVPVESGLNWVELRFRGEDLLRQGQNGPYTVANVRLIDYRHGGLIVDTIADLHTTAAYAVSDLAAASLPLPHQTGPAAGRSSVGLAAHDCTVTPSAVDLTPGSTFAVACDLVLDSGGYPEWLDYYYIVGPSGWPVSDQSAAPANMGGWAEPTTALTNSDTGLAYWGLDYDDPATLDLVNGVLPDAGTFWGPWRPDGDATYQFGLTYTLPETMPTCPGALLIGFQAGRYSLTAVAVGDLIAHSVNQKVISLGGSACPLPQISLAATVSSDGSCPGQTAISLPETGQGVTFCHRLTNLSDQVTVVSHSLSQPPIVDDAFNVALAPGESHTLSQTVTITEAVGRCYRFPAAWTAQTALGYGQPPAGDATDPFSERTYQAQAEAAPLICVGIEVPKVYLPLVGKGS